MVSGNVANASVHAAAIAMATAAMPKSPVMSNATVKSRNAATERNVNEMPPK